jgi:ribose transport system permease protein
VTDSATLTSAEPAMDEASQQSRVHALARRLGGSQATAVTVVLVLLVAFFAAENPTAFISLTNLRTITLDASSTLLLAVGMTFLIISGGLDLSVGAVVVFASVVSAKAMGGLADDTATALIGLLVALGAGLGWGVINGALISWFSLNPIIVTLGTLGAAEGLGDVISGGVDVTTIPATLTNGIGIDTFIGIPDVVWITLVPTVLAAIALRMTRFGAHTYAIGANQEAARRAGIRVEWHRTALYGLTGMLAGLTAFLLNARFGTTSIAGHDTDNLVAITAVVLGGASLAGGVGTIFGTVIGVLIPALLTNGFTILGISSFWQEVAVGAVLIGAVLLDRARRRREESSGTTLASR